jgi:hypothetical protein
MLKSAIQRRNHISLSSPNRSKERDRRQRDADGEATRASLDEPMRAFTFCPS